MSDVAIDGFLGTLGLGGEAAGLARAALEDAGLTNPRKTRMSEAKLGAARDAIDEVLARLCRRCAAAAAGETRIVVTVPAAACARCGGSSNVRALDDLVTAAAAAGARRLVVVGGSPDVRRELGSLDDRLEVRCVEGVARRTAAQAQRDVAWADVVCVCGSSELYHRVSDLYTRDPGARGKLVVSSRRGVEAIAGEIVEHLRRRT